MTTDSTLSQKLYPLEPDYRERVWGGRRLKDSDPPVGEAWVAFEQSRVRGGAHAGRTVAALVSEYGAQFLGRLVAQKYGACFPLLVKLLDCADWLSVQVHPNDEQAARLVGPGESGKTEAWYFIDAEPGAAIYAGVRAGTSRDELGGAVRAGRVLDVARRLTVAAGDVLYIPAGTLHALGPGLLLYEVQQSCDTTFRVYDWDRPASAGRKLHLEESVAVIDPEIETATKQPPGLSGTAAATVLSCPYFDLDVLQVGGDALAGSTEGLAFHILTAIEGSVEVACAGEVVRLGRFETALVAGSAGAYQLLPAAGVSKVLRAGVPAPRA